MVDVWLLFCSTLFCFVERIRVFASLVESDDQSKCKWVFGKNVKP